MTRASVALALGLAVAGCSGGGGSGSGTACGSGCDGSSTQLVETDVQRVIAQAVGEARARGLGAQLAVVDRVGNVLAVYETGTAPQTVDIASGLVASGAAGLDGLRGTVPATHAAIAKAITAAFLSSGGNAFSTRTAGQIVQEHFNPQEAGQPSGPLYGVQFSQLACSDVNRNLAHGSVGPKRSPLGLAADPGGIPLYKAGVLVGAIGVEADGLYGFDRDLTDRDDDVEEAVALAGAAGFAAPDDIRAERITADGRTLRYAEPAAARSDPAAAPSFAALGGRLVAVAGFNDATVHRGTAFGSAGSGVRADAGAFASSGAWVLVDESGADRFPVRAGAGAGGLTSAEVQAILAEAIAVARRARGQIRRPLGSFAEVSVSVVDVNGDILGLVRTPDAPVFGIDVAVQKARTAMFFSRPDAAALLAAAPPATYLDTTRTVAPGAYVTALRDFLGDPAALSGAIAWSARAVGNVHRPAFPDGIDGAGAGPLSTAPPEWSPFNVGLQLDLIYNQLVKGVLGDVSTGCAGRLPAGATTVAADTGIAALRNGAQIFPGGIPVYRGDRLVGGLGVSGDGVDQDDMVAYLGLANAAASIASGVGNAPAAMRADVLAPHGTRLRYVQCPQSPFNGSSEQNVCR